MAKIHEHKELRNRTQVFADRAQAGEILARMLAPRYSGAPDVVMLAIPMGGVPVALQIRYLLNCPLDLLIVRKLRVPDNPEAGFGAVTPSGDLFLNEPLLAQLGLAPDQVERESRTVQGELAARNRLLRGDRPMPALDGKIVILVDDGLASGFTMQAAIFMIAKAGALKKVVAVPCAPHKTITALEDSVDEIYCANIRESFSFAVADAYRNWRDLTEGQAAALLKEAGLLG